MSSPASAARLTRKQWNARLHQSPYSANRSGNFGIVSPRALPNCPREAQTVGSHVKDTSNAEITIGNVPKMERAFPLWMATSICCLRTNRTLNGPPEPPPPSADPTLLEASRPRHPTHRASRPPLGRKNACGKFLHTL